MRLKPCDTPDCERLTSLSSMHCCGPCASAAEGRYEIDLHTHSCDARWNERKQLTGGALLGKGAVVDSDRLRHNEPSEGSDATH